MTSTRFITARRGLLGAFCVSLSLLLQGPAQAQEKVSIRMDWAPSGVHAPFHIALAKGWFKDAGLDVDLQDGKGTANTLQLVATDTVDIGEVTVGVVPISRESGMKVQVIMGIAQRNALAIVVPKESPYQTPQDLKGKRILLFAASPWTPFVDPYFKAAGMTRNDVQMVFVDPSALLPSYASGQGEAFMTLGPGAAHMLKSRPSRAIPADAYGIAFPDHGLIASENFIAKRPAVAQKVVDVAIRAWKYTLDGHEDEAIAAIVANRPGFNLDRDILKEHLELYKAYLDTPNTKGQPFGWQSRADWEAASKSLLEAGSIKQKVDVTQYYTNRFIAAKTGY